MISFIVRFCDVMAETICEIGEFVLTMTVLAYTGGLLSGAILVLSLENDNPEFVYYAGVTNLTVAPPVFALVVPISVLFVATCTSIVRALPKRNKTCVY